MFSARLFEPSIHQSYHRFMHACSFSWSGPLRSVQSCRSKAGVHKRSLSGGCSRSAEVPRLFRKSRKLSQHRDAHVENLRYHSSARCALERSINQASRRSYGEPLSLLAMLGLFALCAVVPSLVMKVQAAPAGPRALPTPVSVATAKTYLADLVVAVDSNSPAYARDLFKTWDTSEYSEPRERFR